eukprot:g81.t1
MSQAISPPGLSGYNDERNDREIEEVGSYDGTHFLEPVDHHHPCLVKDHRVSEKSRVKFIRDKRISIARPARRGSLIGFSEFFDDVVHTSAAHDREQARKMHEENRKRKIHMHKLRSSLSEKSISIELRNFLQKSLDMFESMDKKSIFADLVSKMQHAEQFSIARQWYNFDKDNDSRLTIEDFANYAATLTKDADVAKSGDVRMLFSCLNVDRDGTLSRKEFIASTCMRKAQDAAVSRILDDTSSNDIFLLCEILGCEDIGCGEEKVSYSTECQLDEGKLLSKNEKYKTSRDWDSSHYVLHSYKIASIEKANTFMIRKGDKVRILHRTLHNNAIATVIDPDFEGRARVILEGKKRIVRSFDLADLVLFESSRGETFQGWLDLYPNKVVAERHPQNLEELATVRQFCSYPLLPKIKSQMPRLCVRYVLFDPSHIGLLSMYRLSVQQNLYVTEYMLSEAKIRNSKIMTELHRAALDSINESQRRFQRYEMEMLESVERDAAARLDETRDFLRNEITVTQRDARKQKKVHERETEIMKVQVDEMRQKLSERVGTLESASQLRRRRDLTRMERLRAEAIELRAELERSKLEREEVKGANAQSVRQLQDDFRRINDAKVEDIRSAMTNALETQRVSAAKQIRRTRSHDDRMVSEILTLRECRDTLRQESETEKRKTDEAMRALRDERLKHSRTIERLHEAESRMQRTLSACPVDGGVPDASRCEGEVTDDMSRLLQLVESLERERDELKKQVSSLHGDKCNGLHTAEKSRTVHDVASLSSSKIPRASPRAWLPVDAGVREVVQKHRDRLKKCFEFEAIKQRRSLAKQRVRGEKLMGYANDVWQRFVRAIAKFRLEAPESRDDDFEAAIRIHFVDEHINYTGVTWIEARRIFDACSKHALGGAYT